MHCNNTYRGDVNTWKSVMCIIMCIKSAFYVILRDCVIYIFLSTTKIYFQDYGRFVRAQIKKKDRKKLCKWFKILSYGAYSFFAQQLKHSYKNDKVALGTGQNLPGT